MTDLKQFRINLKYC